MVSRGISEKTIKILWAKAGGMCAYPNCRKPLIAEAPTSNGDPHAVLGQMAHIVAHSLEGPRGEQNFRGKNRDGLENLVLLCPEHHILVDQQRESHPADWLYRMKEQHERWIAERLSVQIQFPQILPIRHDVFAEYRKTCRPNTLQRHDYDLRAFSTFLSTAGIKRTEENLRSNPLAWRGMTYGILAAFRRWLEERSEAVGTIRGKMRDSDIQGKVASSSIRISFLLTHVHCPSHGE